MLRPDRRGRHAHLAFRDAGRRGGRGALHRPVHRRRVPARSQMGQHSQPARLLLPGDRGDGRPLDRGPGRDPHRGAVPGRLVWPRRLSRRAAGAGPARHGARVYRALSAQHDRREDRPVGPAARRSGGSDHDRCLPARGGVDHLGAPRRDGSDVPHRLLRGQQCPGRGARQCRRGCIRHAGGSVSHRRLPAGGRSLSARPGGLRPGAPMRTRCCPTSRRSRQA